MTNNPFNHYSSSKDLLSLAQQERSRIKEEVQPKYHKQKYEELSSSIKQYRDLWNKQIDEGRTAAREKVNELEKKMAAYTKIPSYSADEVKVLEYTAKMLRDKASVIENEIEFKDFIESIRTGAPEMKRAFIDNAPSILRGYKEDINAGTIRNYINDIQTASLSESDMEDYASLKSEIREAEEEITALTVQSIAIDQNFKSLESSITQDTWHLGDEKDSI